MHPAIAVLVATNDDPPKLRLAAGKYRRLHLVADPGRTTAVRYNAGWTPRAYGISAKGRLTYVEADTESEAQAMDAMAASG